MKTSIKTIGLLAALAVGLTSPLFSQVPDLTKDTQSVDRKLTYLPVMIDVMTRERHYNPRVQMLKQLKHALAKWKNDSAPGKLIVAGFTKATMNREVLPELIKRYNATKDLGDGTLIAMIIDLIRLAFKIGR